MCLPLLASHVLVFLSHFVSRDHFESEVSCGSPMASASWALLPGGDRWDGSVSREAAIENPCTRFFVLVPALFLFSHTNFDNFCGSLQQLFFWISLSLCFSPFWCFRAEERHLSVMSRDRRRKRHPRHHQVAERRGCVETGPLQRSVIHDIIGLLNGDGGLWVDVVTGTLKTHIIIFLWTCFDVLSQPRGYYDAFATAGADCSAGRESGCSPRKALPGPSSSAPSTSSSSRWAGAAAYLSTQLRASHQSGKTGQLHCFFVIFGQYLRSDGAAAVVVTCRVSHRALRCLLLHRRAASG